MRALVLVLALVVSVPTALVAGVPTAVEAQDDASGAALEVVLTAGLLDRGSLPDVALSLVGGLQTTANLKGFELRLHMSDGVLRGNLSARFVFASLTEMTLWYESGAVQKLLASIENASDAPSRLEVRGRLVGK